MITYYEKSAIIEHIPSLLKPVDVLVDVGCGVRPFGIQAKTHICVEPWKEYIDILNACHGNKSTYVFLQTDAITGLKTFADHSVDSVCMIDLIEHLEKKDGQALLQEADRIARKQIIIFTPLGYMANHSDSKDAWGLNGAHLQEHLSGWNVEDFDDTWDLHVCKDFHIMGEHHVGLDKNYGCIWAIKNKNVELTPLADTPQFVRDCVKLESCEYQQAVLNKLDEVLTMLITQQKKRLSWRRIAKNFRFLGKRS